MLRNYFTTAVRNLRQNPLFSAINILSLAIGLASCGAIYLFIADERSFDAFNEKRSRIYRVDEIQNFTGTIEQRVALTGSPFGPKLLHDFPEIEKQTRYWGRENFVVKKGAEKLLLKEAAFVDSTFLEMFDYPLIAGNRNTALDEPRTIVVTKTTALKLFKDVETALNNTIRLGDNDYKITGILSDVIENSHLQFQALMSITEYSRKDPKFDDEWASNFLTTYILLKPNTDGKKLESKLYDFMIRFTGQKDMNKTVSLFLQQLPQVHLGSTDIEHDYHNYRKFNGSYLGVFEVVGIFILLIASVNFMNLTTARSSYRGKEIGVRKSIGAKRTQLFTQFIFESVMLAVLALFVAVAIDLFCLPLLSNAIGRHLQLLYIVGHPVRLVAAAGIAIGLGLLTGVYPSIYMTASGMVGLLKGGARAGKKSLLNSTLVVVQFGLALAMIVSTLIVLQQIYFMKNKDVGFNKDEIMLLNMNKEVNEKYAIIKAELIRNPYIKGVTASGQRIGNNFHQWGFKIKMDTGVANFTPSNVNVDYDYLTVYGIKMAEGRNFSKDVPTDTKLAFIINESMAKELKLKEAVGTTVGHGWYNNDSLGSVIGVVKDFNFNSLHHTINTLSIVYHPDWGFEEMSVKIDGAHHKEAIAAIKSEWDKNILNYPFSYSFLDDHIDSLYQSDRQMSTVVSIMAALAIFISCMGLFGLAAITMERKIKEIGIRKTLGATESQLIVLLSRNFAMLVLISFVIASPATYYVLSKWLQQFAYHVGIDPWLFLVGGGLAFFIAIGTVSYHTLRSARQNPVKALRYE